MGALDELLPRFLLECIQIYLVMFSILTLNAAALVWTLLPTTMLLLLFYTILQIYLKSAQSIKRLEGTSELSFQYTVRNPPTGILLTVKQNIYTSQHLIASLMTKIFMGKHSCPKYQEITSNAIIS